MDVQLYESTFAICPCPIVYVPLKVRRHKFIRKKDVTVSRYLPIFAIQ